MNQDVAHSQHSSHLQLATTAEKHHVTTDYAESDVNGIFQRTIAAIGEILTPFLNRQIHGRGVNNVNLQMVKWGFIWANVYVILHFFDKKKHTHTKIMYSRFVYFTRSIGI